MARAFAPDLPLGCAPQFPVHELQQVFEGRLFAAAGGAEKTSHIAGFLALSFHCP
jgi:hypothetical protein